MKTIHRNIISDYTMSSLFKHTRWIYFTLLQLLFPGLMSVASQISPDYLNIKFASAS
jgi:hypothetical protein